MVRLVIDIPSIFLAVGIILVRIIDNFPLQFHILTLPQDQHERTHVQLGSGTESALFVESTQCCSQQLGELIQGGTELWVAIQQCFKQVQVFSNVASFELEQASECLVVFLSM